MKSKDFIATIKIMLDKNDLSAIGNLIKEGNESVKQDLRKEITAGNESVKQELRLEISGVKQELKIEFSKQLKKEINPLKKDIRKIKASVETVINFFDKENINLEKRVARVEDHLGLPPMPISP